MPTTKKTAPSTSLTVPIRNLNADTVGEANLPEEIFGVPFRRHIVWEVVRSIRARQHAGTHKVKSRDEVSGTGKKPFKQKHTGRARQGGGRPPIHRHGGTVHGPIPRSYDLKVNVATKKAALRCVLSEKLRENRLFLVESLELPTHRTAELAAVMVKLGITGKALLLDKRENVKLAKAARNNPALFVEDALGLDAYSALEATTVILTEQALKTVTEVLG